MRFILISISITLFYDIKWAVFKINKWKLKLFSSRSKKCANQRKRRECHCKIQNPKSHREWRGDRAESDLCEVDLSQLPPCGSCYTTQYVRLQEVRYYYPPDGLYSWNVPRFHFSRFNSKSITTDIAIYFSCIIF